MSSRLPVLLCVLSVFATPSVQAQQSSAAPSAPASAASGSSAQLKNTSTIAPASVSGTVTGPQNAIISGAQVRLTSSGGTIAPQVLTDSNGRFRFTGVPAGSFKVTVLLQGFDPVSFAGVVQPGQDDELAPLILRLSTVDTVVNALTPDELALEQVHAEEKQRLIGLFPNFYVSYTWQAEPLTARQKFGLATKNVSDPGNLLLVGALAGEQQAQNAFPGYHQGAAGYGKRFGADLGNLVVGTYMGGAVLPALFRQDPRYFYKGTGSIKSRFWYAVSRAVICRGDNGNWQPAFAGVLGDLSAGAISNIYYPASDRQGAALTFENGFLGVAGDALNNVFEEFILRKLTPKLAKATQ